MGKTTAGEFLAPITSVMSVGAKPAASGVLQGGCYWQSFDPGSRRRDRPSSDPHRHRLDFPDGR